MLKLNLLSIPFHLFLMLLCFHIITSSTAETGDKLSDVLSALKEVAFSYYMRGKHIQYCSARKSFFPPEEATSQKINYVVCSKIVNNIYKELLNITTPDVTKSYINYAYHRKKNPEIVVHTSLRNIPQVEVTFKFPNYKAVKINPTYEDLVPYLQPGDILIHFWNKTGSHDKGHTRMVYDITADKKDALIMESADNEIMVNTKLQNFEIYLSKKNNSFLNPKREEGTIKIIKLSEIDEWKVMNQTYYYTIIRFIHADENGIAKLHYDSDFKSTDSFKDKESITLLPKEKDRITFSHLYIEKTVDKHNNNYVQIGDKLIYKIIIKNSGDSDYNQNLIVTEQLDEKVEFIDNLADNKIPFINNESKKTLEWTIKKLQNEEEIIIEYSVEVKGGNPKDVIISTGKVGNIPSSTVNNIIGKSLYDYEQIHIKNIYNKLKSNYTSINLINEIYKEAFNVDIGLNELNLTDLINNHDVASLNQKPSLNRNNIFSKIVFTNHFSAIANQSNETFPVVYKFKNFRDYYSPGRRQDFIYPELFQTGDILIYTNYFDYNYKKNYNYTYENGEYAYIYIDNKFVGNNPGLDGKMNNRKEFTAQYYKDNNLTLLKADYDIEDKRWLELANLQTLFSKNYYAIFRPSLYYNFTIQCEAGKYLNKNKLCQRCSNGQISSKGALKCEKCPAGTHEVKNGTECKKCPLGFYSGEGYNFCIGCKEENYYDKENKQCTKCKENYYLEEDTFKCKKCPDGYLSKIGSFYASSCKKCSPGQYFSYKYGYCLFCSGGTYSTSNVTECSICPAGTYSNFNSSSCLECPAGTYSPESSSHCYNCPAGTFSNAKSASCTPCKSGTFSRVGYDKCLDCKIGTYSFEGASKCLECPAGQYLSNGECKNCEPGTYSTSGAVECTLCDAGTFSEEGYGYCQKCKSGFYSDKGASSCKMCPAGTISGEGFAKCINCPGGFYSSVDGANSCLVCPADKYSNVGAKSCSSCPKGKKSEPGSAQCY